MKYQRVKLYHDHIDECTTIRYTVEEILAFSEHKTIDLVVKKKGSFYEMWQPDRTDLVSDVFIPEEHPWFNIGLIFRGCWHVTRAPRPFWFLRMMLVKRLK